MNPVDMVARAIVVCGLSRSRVLSFGDSSFALVVHLASPNPLSLADLGTIICANHRELSMIPYSEWIQRLYALHSRAPRVNPLAPLLSFFPRNGVPLSSEFSQLTSTTVESLLRRAIAEGHSGKQEEHARINFSTTIETLSSSRNRVAIGVAIAQQIAFLIDRDHKVRE
jgi:hypothetical protein